MSQEVRKAFKKYLPHLLQARDANLNEAETVQRLVKVFEDAFGYDALSEISRESQIKHGFVDIAIKIDGVTKLLVEAKAASTTLRDRHIEQAQRYASEGNIRWVLLTNGIAWNLYHLTFEEGIEYERAFSVDLTTDPMDKACDCLALLERQSVMRGKHEEYWQRRTALGAHSIAKSLFSESVLSMIRRDIRRRDGVLIDIEDLASGLHELFSPEAREQIGVVRIRKHRKAKARTASAEKEPAIPPTQEPQAELVPTVAGTK